jgi:hypothetical protein
MKKTTHYALWLLPLAYLVFDGASRTSIFFAIAFFAGWAFAGTPAVRKIASQLLRDKSKS